MFKGSARSFKAFGEYSSVTARLTFLFEAINATQKGNKIKIENISVQAKTMTVNGSMAGRGYINDFLNQIDKHKKLQKTNVKVGSNGPLAVFKVTIELK